MRIGLLALALGAFLVASQAYAGPVPGGPDNDGDTVEDAGITTALCTPGSCRCTPE